MRSFEGRRSREEKEGAFVKINGAELQRIKDLDFLHLHKKSSSLLNSKTPQIPINFITFLTSKTHKTCSLENSNYEIIN